MSLAFRDYFDLVRSNRNFRLLWFAQIVSELGDWLYSIVLYSLLLERTGSAQAVSTAVILQVLPQVMVAPMAGVLNDRLPRRAVMIAADLTRFVVILGMILAIRLPSVWPMYILLLAETVMWGLFEPGRSALIPNLTHGDRETLAANTLATTTWSFNLAIGAALGGFLAVLIGRNGVFLVNALSFLFSAFLLGRMRIEEPHAAGQPPMRARDLVDFSPVADGFRYITADKRLLACLLAKFGLGIMGANYIILSIYGDRIFRFSNSAMIGMSILMGSRGLGAIIGPALGGWWAGGRVARYRSGILFGYIAAMAGYVGLSRVESLPVGIACIVLAHAGGSIVWVFSTTMLQTIADDKFRGRVFSADYAFLVAAMSASSWLAGFAFDAGVGIRTISLVMGLLVLLPAAAWAFGALPLWADHADS